MKIRSITCFINPAYGDVKENLSILSEFTKKAKMEYQQAGYDVQSLRLATTPFPTFLPELDRDTMLGKVVTLERNALDFGFDYLAIGPALPEYPHSYEIIPFLLSNSKSVFISGVMADRKHGVDLSACRSCAKVIEMASSITPDGFTNLRFTALANVQPYGPFFPSAYHQGDRLAFALAIESADLAQLAFHQAASLIESRDNLVTSIEGHASCLEEIADQLANEFHIEFKGMDFSLAPFPDDNCSLGGAIEALGAEKIGYSGALAASAFVADALDRGRWKKAGFNGLMLPVLEDSFLARRSIEGSLQVRDLLLYSAVCGTGLDTVPLPGDTSAEELEGLLVDIASLSMRLDKPLTARLMPIPGKKAGDMTEFNFAFFVNGRVLEKPFGKLKGKLKGTEKYFLDPKYILSTK